MLRYCNPGSNTVIFYNAIFTNSQFGSIKLGISVSICKSNSLSLFITFVIGQSNSSFITILRYIQSVRSIRIVIRDRISSRSPRSADSYDYIFTAEAKSIPLIHEMARQSGAAKYFIARKGAKAYMPDPIHVEDHSITTAGTQKLFLGRDDADLIRGKRILIMDDVISTGGSLKAMEALVQEAGGVVTGKVAVLAEGDAADRTDIKFLKKLPLFNADGTVKD